MQKHRRRLLACTVLLCTLALGTAAGCAPSSELPAVQPQDFGFVAAYGPYAGASLDTFNGTFTEGLHSSRGNPETVELRLTPGELTSLYQDLRAMRILDYPASLDPSNTDKTAVTYSTPTSYQLKIRAGGVEKSTGWVHGELVASTLQAKALLGWFEKLQRMIEAKPEYQRLPPIGAFGYE
jgi:hypothetical protein